VQECDRFVSHFVGLVFEVQDARDPFGVFAFLACKTSEQLGKRGAGGDDLGRMLVEEIEEPVLAGHQL
jgi:hypothetical protein